jgi:hypothetical protein
MARAVTAFVFTIRTLETGRLVGQAVICPAVRYASVQWRGALRPDRRLAPLEQWLAIDDQVADKFEGGPLTHASAIPRLLLGDRGPGYVVQYFVQEPLPETDPVSPELLRLLDARLTMGLAW